MIEVYGIVPEYDGWGRPPTRKKPGTEWLYLQMVKQRDEQGRFAGTTLQAIFGSLEEVTQLLGETTSYIERSNLTSRLFNGRQVRKTLAFSKNVEYHRAAATWEDLYYNFVKPHKSLRLPVSDIPGRKWKPRTPAMAAALTDHIWTVKELLYSLPLKCELLSKGRLPTSGNYPQLQDSSIRLSSARNLSPNLPSLRANSAPNRGMNEIGVLTCAAGVSFEGLDGV